jgi:hypothetical protein
MRRGHRDNTTTLHVGPLSFPYFNPKSSSCGLDNHMVVDVLLRDEMSHAHTHTHTHTHIHAHTDTHTLRERE